MHIHLRQKQYKGTAQAGSVLHGTRCRLSTVRLLWNSDAEARRLRQHLQTVLPQRSRSRQTLRRRHLQVKKASEPCNRPVSRRRAREFVRRQTKGICHVQETLCQRTLHISQSGPGCPCPSCLWFRLGSSRCRWSGVFLAVVSGSSFGFFLRFLFFPRFRVFSCFSVFSVGGEPGRGLIQFPGWCGVAVCVLPYQAGEPQKVQTHF